jgi:hypothetical protein
VVECPDRVPSSSPSYATVSTQRTEFPVAAAAAITNPTTKPTDVNSISTQVCEDSNAKFFKLILNANASSSTTSWTLYDNSGNIVERSGSILDTDTEYVKRICVTPNSYRFEVSGIGEGCYEGYLRGNLIFESCDDGVHDFTLELV